MLVCSLAFVAKEKDYPAAHIGNAQPVLINLGVQNVIAVLIAKKGAKKNERTNNERIC